MYGTTAVDFCVVLGMSSAWREGDDVSAVGFNWYMEGDIASRESSREHLLNQAGLEC